MKLHLKYKDPKTGGWKWLTCGRYEQVLSLDPPKATSHACCHPHAFRSWSAAKDFAAIMGVGHYKIHRY